MVGSIGMHFVVEVVQQRGNRPLVFVLAKLSGISRHATFHCQRMFAQALGFRELVEDGEGLFAGEHGVAGLSRDLPQRWGRRQSLGAGKFQKWKRAANLTTCKWI